METKHRIVGMTMSNTHYSTLVDVTTLKLRYSNIFSSFQTGYKTVISSQLKCKTKILVFINRIVKKPLYQHNIAYFTWNVF